MNNYPTTSAELFALPEAQGFGYRIEGNARIPTMPPVEGAFFVEHDAVLSAIDENGICWTLGQYLDGTWFKRRR